MVNISISVDSKHPTVSETVSSSLPCLVVRIYLNHLKHIQYKSSSKSKKVILVSSQKNKPHITYYLKSQGIFSQNGAVDNVHDNINNECISFIPKSQSLGFMSILRTPAICGFVFEPFECSSSRESLRKIVLKRNTRIPNTKRLSQPPTITIPGFA